MPNNPYIRVVGVADGDRKIDDELFAEPRQASGDICRSINAQAEFWLKSGILAEADPTLSYTEIITCQLKDADVEMSAIHVA